MALSEQEEFELLSLERERAMGAKPQPKTAPEPKSRFRQAVDDLTPVLNAASTMSMGPVGMGVKLAGKGLENLSHMVDEAAYKAGGAVTDITGSPEVGYGVNVGIQAIPAVASGQIAKPVLGKIGEAVGKRLMQSAVKPTSADILSGNAERGVQTLLDEGINVTPTGMAELRRRVGSLHEQVKNEIASSTSLVDKSEVANSVDRAFNKFRYAMVNRDSNLQTIKAAKDDFLKAIEELDPLSQYSGSIPIQLAQKIKQHTQRLLSDEYGSLSGAQYEGAKDIAHGLRVGIEKGAPDVAGKNAKMEELLNALSVTERQAIQALNKNPAGLSLLAENPAAAVSFMADRSAAFKSLLARMIYTSSAEAPNLAVGGAGAALQGLHSNTTRH